MPLCWHCTTGCDLSFCVVVSVVDVVYCAAVLCHAVLCRSDPPSDTKEQPALTREHILAACDASLRRLQTDYIDLYQIHCELPTMSITKAACI